MPLFPELRRALLDVFEQAAPGTEFVITRYRGTNANLRTQLQRIVKRAGLKPWPKLFHNLRSTRQTELAERFPIHVMCSWLGNSRAIAQAHYLQVTDAHFDQAARLGWEGTAQIPAQYPAVQDGNPKNSRTDEEQNHLELPADSVPYDCLPAEQVTPTGFEPVSRP